ncbi:hypothetical protein Tco_0864262 [Tanacetum coccineum]
MALAGSERDAKDALSKLLQLGTVEDYQREFEMLIKRVTIPESLLKSFYISGLKLDLQFLQLWEKTSSMGVSRACFEIIAKEDKEHIVEKKIDVLLPLKEVVGGGEALGIGEDDDLGDATTDGGDVALSKQVTSLFLISLTWSWSPDVLFNIGKDRQRLAIRIVQEGGFVCAYDEGNVETTTATTNSNEC